MLELFTTDSLLLAHNFDNIRFASLIIGLGVFSGGVLLLINHKRHIDQVADGNASDRIKAFEARKFRRRAAVSTMIACLGCTLGALYWVTDQKVFAVFIMMSLALLLGIFGLAVIDFFSVGLHHLATPDQKAQKKMIEEYLRQREKLLNKVDDESAGEE